MKAFQFDVRCKAIGRNFDCGVTASEEDSPSMVNLSTLATFIFLSRKWSHGRNTIVMLEVEYSSASCAYTDNVTQWVELSGE